MPRPVLLLGLGLCTLSVGACRGPEERAAEVELRAEELLARWFPEAARPVDRARLLAALVPEAPARTAAASPHEEEVRQAAEAALAQADWARARDLLVELLGPREIEEAAAVLESGDCARALAMLDRAARTSPESPRLASLRARARLAVGSSQGTDGRDLVQLALEDGLRAARATGGAEDWTAASQAAFWLGTQSQAREYADEAVARGGARVDGAAELARAVASVAELHALEAGGSEPESLREPAARARRALQEYLGFAPEDPWTWRELSALFEHHELAGRALETTACALRVAPADAELHARFARLALALGGRERLLSEYDRFTARHPEVALGAWYPAVQRYESGCELLRADRAAQSEFEAAEALFARARALAPQFEAACRDYEAACRVGLGWSLVLSNAREPAERAFRSAEELAPGTFARELPAGLPGALSGIERLADRWAKEADPEHPEAALESLRHAGELFELLHAHAPRNADWANNAGFFLRDVAYALERQGRAACARGAKEAEATLARARELMERSWNAYRDAAELAPDDVRIQNDCALVLVNYLQRDADEAERRLRHAIELGEAQRPALESAASAPDLDGETRDARRRALEELVGAIGDAWQNLGVLELTLRGDARAAREPLERCRTLGSDPRPEVVGPGGFLETCRKALAGELDPRITEQTRWAAACPRR